MRPYAAAAGVALLGASVIAVTPVAPPPAPEVNVASAEVRLAAASSLLNVPVNLLIDLVNIPHNEVQALDYLSRSLIFSGPWFVVSATNIWGVDPGDPGHFMSTVNLLVPFPALSGLGLDQSNQTGLGQQLWHFVAAELPVSKYCDASGCPPGVPISPITGITSVDQTLWGLALTAGLYSAWVKFPLFNNWFTVPISELVSGYTFGPNRPGYADPSGPVYPGFGFQGTTEVNGPNGPEYLMPWANTTFTLDLSKPFQNYFDHLMADPATNPIHLPDLVEFGRTLQTLAAALVIAFDPLTPGAGLCTGGPGNCSWLPPALDYPGIVKSIGDLWPGNPVINEWLDALANGTANVPTKKQIDTAARLAQQNSSFWDFGNPSPPPELISGFNLSTLAPFFHQQWTALGFNPPPLATDPAPATDPLQQQPLLGGATLDSIPQGSEGQQNGPNTGVQQKVDPNNVLASSVTGGPSNVAGKFDNLSKAVVPDVGKPALTPTSLRNGLSIADELPAGPAEPPKTSTESTGKDDGGSHSATGKDGNGSANNSSNGGTESGSPRHAKQSETGPRHAKADNDNDSSGGTTTAAAAGANTGRTPTKTP